MADVKKYMLDGYRFSDSDSYEQARRELAKIAEIKTEKDLKNEESLREIYDTLVESEEFETPVGIGFLREAQKRLIKNPEQRKTMKAIPFHVFVREVIVNNGLAEPAYVEVEPFVEVKAEAETAADTEAENQARLAETEKNLTIINSLKAKIRNYRIIIAFLIIMVIIPFGVLFYDKVLNPNLAEEALINEYAAWKEELTKKEQELNEREQILEDMNIGK